MTQKQPESQNTWYLSSYTKHLTTTKLDDNTRSLSPRGNQSSNHHNTCIQHRKICTKNRTSISTPSLHKMKNPIQPSSKDYLHPSTLTSLNRN
ncbi:hypothetical protein PR048_025641 [Dryococelus australis]|uniref:Uncharacterized protein n=1 Tax=Dryococelus australis TaxID=614101 RepID=A0ABQ9GRX1_9NEOP|nr:hypothetical protein PR048_025641 [Dryococelus australis]